MVLDALKWILWKLKILIKFADKIHLDNIFIVGIKGKELKGKGKAEFEVDEFHYELHPKIKKLFK